MSKAELAPMQEMEKIGTRPYVVVYFNADTPLGLFPHNTFFLDAHSALHSQHRRQMKVGTLSASADISMCTASSDYRKRRAEIVKAMLCSSDFPCDHLTCYGKKRTCRILA